ncbi:hypothetical protein NVSP9465_03825 [Novosphingobium sp. CECT 9465]|nr:hypothetical protein NVSP9465_03825 [Novosphingobium sp. CECT 9465]
MVRELGDHDVGKQTCAGLASLLSLDSAKGHS